MHNPPPPHDGTTGRTDPRHPAGVRTRQTSMWLVFAVLAAIIVVILAVSFDRTPDPATTAAEPAADGAGEPAATATTGTADTGTADTGTADTGTADTGATDTTVDPGATTGTGTTAPAPTPAP